MESNVAGSIPVGHPQRKSIMKNNLYKITILRPGGNDQLLIEGVIRKEKRRKINDAMIKKFPNVEQVSFYNYDKENNTAVLELAGGEFCGNATRSLAYLLLQGKKGKLQIKVSGTTQSLDAGVRIPKTAYAQMPINQIQPLKQLSKNLFQVNLQGIIHLIYTNQPKVKTDEALKRFAFKLLQKENLVYSVPAAGVMFLKQYKNYISLKPIVWVRDIETLLFETACASGTAAVGIWKAFVTNNANKTIDVLQPTGKIIKACVKKNKKNSFEVFIDGQIETIKETEVISL